MQNIAGHCQQTFDYNKFVASPSNVLPYYFSTNNLNFHWRWRWWDWIQAIFLNLFYFILCSFFKVLPQFLLYVLQCCITYILLFITDTFNKWISKCLVWLMGAKQDGNFLTFGSYIFDSFKMARLKSAFEFEMSKFLPFFVVKVLVCLFVTEEILYSITAVSDQGS